MHVYDIVKFPGIHVGCQFNQCHIFSIYPLKRYFGASDRPASSPVMIQGHLSMADTFCLQNTVYCKQNIFVQNAFSEGDLFIHQVLPPNELQPNHRAKYVLFPHFCIQLGAAVNTAEFTGAVAAVHARKILFILRRLIERFPIEEQDIQFILLGFLMQKLQGIFFNKIVAVEEINIFSPCSSDSRISCARHSDMVLLDYLYTKILCAIVLQYRGRVVR